MIGVMLLLIDEARRRGLCMLNVLQKASRLADGTKDDSWLDIAGYTENVGMLRRDQRNVRTPKG